LVIPLPKLQYIYGINTYTDLANPSFEATRQRAMQKRRAPGIVGSAHTHLYHRSKLSFLDMVASLAADDVDKFPGGWNQSREESSLGCAHTP